jgi:hypothetical protein
MIGRLVGQGPLAASLGKQGGSRQTIFPARFMTYCHKYRAYVFTLASIFPGQKKSPGIEMPGDSD